MNFGSLDVEEFNIQNFSPSGNNLDVPKFNAHNRFSSNGFETVDEAMTEEEYESAPLS